MSGVYGWLGPLEADPQQTMASMQMRATGAATKPAFSAIGAGFAGWTLRGPGEKPKLHKETLALKKAKLDLAA